MSNGPGDPKHNVHLIEFIRLYEPDEQKKYEWIIYLEKIRREIRNECLLMFIILNLYYFRSEYTLENILFI